jgi:tyrosyl-tRNA synthetase
MDVGKRLELVKRNTQEIVTEDELKKLLASGRKPVVYLGTAITGKPHIGYFVWVVKFSDFLKAGFKVKLLLADLHGALDQTPWDLLERRYEYYKEAIPLMFDAIGADRKDFEIIKGSSFQKDKDYFYDVLKVSTHASIHDLMKASSEVVKQSENPKLASLIYPIMQALDEEYLGVDVQCGGVDQRKIFMFAREYLPKIGYNPRIELMTPLVPGLLGEKMSASKEESKVDLLDSAETIRSKLKKAFCPPGVVEGNGVLSFVKHVIMVLKEDSSSTLTIKRTEKHGGDLAYSGYAEIEKDYTDKRLHPDDLKNAVANEIIQLLHPFNNEKEQLKSLANKAFP